MRFKTGILVGSLFVMLLSVKNIASWPTVASASSSQVRQAAPARQRHIGEVPQAANSKSFTGRMDSSEKIRMILSFQERDEAALQQTLNDLYDPLSPAFHQWLSPKEFGERFGRTATEMDNAMTWLRQHGFDVDRTYSNRLSIGFTGTVDVVERAFKVEMATYWDQDKKRPFYSNMASPTLPSEFDAIAVELEGMNNFVLYHRSTHHQTFTPVPAQDLKRGKGGRLNGKVSGVTVIAPKDLALLYDYDPLWNANIQGLGQKVGVVIDSDMKDSDMTTYRTVWGLPVANLQRILYPGFANPGLTGDEIETALDAESISATAPAAEIDLVLIPSLNSTYIQTVEQDIVNQNTIKIVNESFGICESLFWRQAEQNIFAQAATQGIAFFAISGDEGADCNPNNLTQHGVECPACYPGVTGVGGTHLVANFDPQGNVIGRSSEVAWNTTPGVRLNCSQQSTGGGASGGGVSTIVTMPPYQAAAQGFAGGVPPGTARFVPDVAAVADPYPGGAPLLVVEGQYYYAGGTSQSSPLWAGMMALLNQAVGSPQGSPNPFLYQMGINQYKNNGPKVYVDITSGNNNVAPVSPCIPSGVTGYSAAVGYDPVSGWGVPDLTVIVLDLELRLAPTSQSFPASGGVGSFGITAVSGRRWNTFSSNTGIATITSVISGEGTTASEGTGNGTVNFGVAVNSVASNRATTIMVSGQPFNVVQGAAFLDVPTSNFFYNEIGKLSARGVTLGCGAGNYCPDATVTRGQMAAFIIRALGDFNPPTPASQRFLDVPPSNTFYAFIDELAARGITLGCGGGNYCPDAPVTREQMAAFIIRALGDFNPPTPTSQRFLDVPPTNVFYAFIDQMAILQITLGCGGGNYCPSDPVTRAQMAAFLVRAFQL
jgi:subtilase family serine protease